jgi:hypothetical protein
LVVTEKTGSQPFKDTVLDLTYIFELHLQRHPPVGAPAGSGAGRITEATGQVNVASEAAPPEAGIRRKTSVAWLRDASSEPLGTAGLPRGLELFVANLKKIEPCDGEAAERDRLFSFASAKMQPEEVKDVEEGFAIRLPLERLGDHGLEKMLCLPARGRGLQEGGAAV